MGYRGGKLGYMGGGVKRRVGLGYRGRWGAREGQGRPRQAGDG